jgi:hypothetical protein
MNTQFRKNLPGTALDYFDARAAVDAIKPGAWASLPYTSPVSMPKTSCAKPIRPSSTSA